ncbi:hypothetical protein B0H17DRAFT_252149 [Mycena rosella]|uniref:Uncharacterized protein n=1 Tax=Mycena rosella TaxID=1033263 RepID=A0AAD7GLC1_MYCRO|nr:hypothetical protein B0H17DRAFT_252149 [Mycena rosella]
MLLGLETHFLSELRQVAVFHVRSPPHSRVPATVIYITHLPDAQPSSSLVGRPGYPPSDDITYPEEQRYTLQWLNGDTPVIRARVSRNADAAFKEHSGIPQPSSALLRLSGGPWNVLAGHRKFKSAEGPRVAAEIQHIC